MRLVVLPLLLLLDLFIAAIPAYAQTGETGTKQYPSLLWEISRHDLPRKSYLFGTMHVSSKLVFHLSDSFYFGIRSADVVALELDPLNWQQEMFRLQEIQEQTGAFVRRQPREFITPASFRLTDFEQALQVALREEPDVVNGLLYRNYQQAADFEEDTYLDLYIYQTGRKLGKRATGVEDYLTTQQIILEATLDRQNEPRGRNSNFSREAGFNLERRMQDAYRKGDLDMLDSLERMSQESEAFTEKFLYLRNEIQAGSIDSIIRSGESLFVGVGAAHLPGKRGVIELLKKQGYQLRPIFMQDRDAARKDEIDLLKVPVHFQNRAIAEAGFSAAIPGEWFRRSDSRINDSWQYADMSNGSYYMVTRVNTHAPALGQTAAEVLKKTDSLLYENIPGKIIRKTSINSDGRLGFDLLSRTRRGDLQRYRIYINAQEVLIFRMSGNGEYVNGPEAETFFNSILFSRPYLTGTGKLQPERAGFSLRFPGTLTQRKIKYDTRSGFGIDYESLDPVNGDGYLLWTRTIHNYNFIEADSFELNLMEESFSGSAAVEKQLSRKWVKRNGRLQLQANWLLKNGSKIYTRFLRRQAQYYMLAFTTRSKSRKPDDFFNSMELGNYAYPESQWYEDSLLGIRVYTPVLPRQQASYKQFADQLMTSIRNAGETSEYGTRNQSAFFQDSITGEVIYLTLEEFPKYYFRQDTASFWKDQFRLEAFTRIMQLRKMEPLSPATGLYGYDLVFCDTGSLRQLLVRGILTGNRFYRLYTMQDSGTVASPFLTGFLDSFRPLPDTTGYTVFSDKLDEFFADLSSRDSATNARAREAIPSIYFGPSGLQRLLQAIAQLPRDSRDYLGTREKLIAELGYIEDSAANTAIIEQLVQIYEHAGDTTTFQNAALRALALNQTAPGYKQLGQLLAADPPVFDGSYAYNSIFNYLDDSLQLAGLLYPEIMQLTGISDYRMRVLGLLVKLVDSGILNPAIYKPQVNNLLFEARLQLKRQLIRDEKLAQASQDGEPGNANAGSYRGNDRMPELREYGTLLAPYYDSLVGVKRVLDRMLESRDESLRLSTILSFLRQGRALPDSLFNFFASNDRYRSTLYVALQKMNRLDRFPVSEFSQVALAKSFLAGLRGDRQPDSLVLLGRQWLRDGSLAGWVYLFKYRTEATDDWRMAVSGIQPLAETEIDTQNRFTNFSLRKLKPELPWQEQFQPYLRSLLFARHAGGQYFNMGSRGRQLERELLMDDLDGSLEP